jgi:hypothetical protein
MGLSILVRYISALPLSHLPCDDACTFRLNLAFSLCGRGRMLVCCYGLMYAAFGLAWRSIFLSYHSSKIRPLLFAAALTPATMDRWRYKIGFNCINMASYARQRLRCRQENYGGFYGMVPRRGGLLTCSAAGSVVLLGGDFPALRMPLAACYGALRCVD